jgi:hypothetical protein
MGKPVTQAQLARELGVSRQAVSKAVRVRRIRPGKDGRFDLEQATARWRATSGGTGAENGAVRAGGGHGARQAASFAPVAARGAQGAPGSGPGVGNGSAVDGGSGSRPDYHLGRAVRETYLAKLARLEYERQVGQLVDASEVRTKAFTAGRRLRERLLAMADRLASVVAGLETRADCHRVIVEEVERALDELDAGAKDGLQ